MKNLLALGSGLLLVTLGAGSWRSAAAQEVAQDAAPGVDARLAALEAKVATLEKKNEESRLLVEQTVVWLEKHGKAAQTLNGVLDQAQEQGFAVGENWKSRETLLIGLRAYLATSQSDLPKLPAAPPAPQPAPAKRPARQ
jgi:hypothetical protein